MISLVTGVGAKGQVGEAVASALARRGDTVIVVSRDDAEVRARAQELRATGATAHGFACDLSNAEAVAALATRVRNEIGDTLDNLVNLAGGFASSGPIADSDPAQFARMFTINASTAYLTTRAFMPLVKNARGSIVYFASEAILEGSRSGGVSAYTASKAAVVALMRSVADEGREFGVRANALAPASIRTATNEASMGAKTKYVEREDVAAVVAWLCSGDSRTVSGQVIRVK